MNVRLKEKMQVKMDMLLLEKEARLPYELLEREDTQDLLARLTVHPFEKVLEHFNVSRKLLRFILEIASVWFVLFCQSRVISVILPLFFIPMLYIAVKCGEMEYDMGETFWAAMRRVKYLQKLLSGRQYVEEREIFQYGGYLDRKWHGYMQDIIKMTAKTERISAVRLTGCKLFAFLALTGQMILLLPALIKGQLTIGIYVGLTKASNDIIQKVVWELAELMRGITRGRRYLADFEKALALPEQAFDRKVQTPAEKVEKIEFRDVSFRYPGSDNQVLNHFSAVFTGNGHYGIVGLNGAGKSTLLKLLIGTYRNYEGEILLNGNQENGSGCIEQVFYGHVSALRLL